MQRRRFLIAGSSTVALALAACNSQAPAASAPAKSAAQPQPAAPSGGGQKVTVASTGVYYALAPTFIANRKGYFKDEGLNVDFQVIKPSAAAAALSSGSVNFITSASTDPISLAAQDLSVLTVAAIEHYVSLDVVVSKKAAEERGLRKDMPNEEKFKRLKGMKVAVSGPGASTDVFLQWMLSQAGLDPKKDATSITAASHGERVAALKSGQVDAFISGPPSTLDVEESGDGLVIIRASTGEIENFGSKFLYEVNFTSKEYAEKNPEVVKKVNKALLRSNQLIFSDLNAALEAMREDFQEMNQKLLAQTMREGQAGFSRDGKMTIDQWKRVVEFAKLSGTLKKDLDLTEGGFWTNKYLA